MECGEAFASPPVPDSQRAVKTAADEFGVVELEAADTRRMARQSSNRFAGLHIPNLDCRIVRASGENVVEELQGHDSIRMTFEDFGAASSILPICADLKPIFVDIFPRSCPLELTISW